jgi:uncharacterized membrane protein
VAVRDLARWLLGLFLLAAGTGHFVVPDAFLAQTPNWLPWRPAIVAISGLIELTLGLALLLVQRHRRALGWVVAAFFVAVFPGNVHQAVTGTDAFGLDTATARWGRLAFQPVLVLWALWATGVLGSGRRARPAPPAGPGAEGPRDGGGRG